MKCEKCGKIIEAAEGYYKFKYMNEPNAYRIECEACGDKDWKDEANGAVL